MEVSQFLKYEILKGGNIVKLVWACKYKRRIIDKKENYEMEANRAKKKRKIGVRLEDQVIDEFKKIETVRRKRMQSRNE